MIEIRHASKEDEQDLLDWRNDRHTVSPSLSNSAVLPENHAKWFGEIVKKKIVQYKSQNKIIKKLVWFDLIRVKIALWCLSI